jgi:hypothetical protein
MRLRLLTAAIAASCMLLVTGCRGPDVTVIPKSELPEDVYSPRPSPSPTVEGEPTRTGTVYMVRKGRLFPVSGQLPSAPTRPEALLAGLLQGPPAEILTPEGKPIAVTSAIPTDAQATGVGVVGNVATVDLSQEFKRGAAGRTLALRVAQIVYTLTEDSTIQSVLFAFERTQAPVINDRGQVLERPVGRKDYVGFAPIEENGAGEANMS